MMLAGINRKTILIFLFSFLLGGAGIGLYEWNQRGQGLERLETVLSMDRKNFQDLSINDTNGIYDVRALVKGLRVIYPPGVNLPSEPVMAVLSTGFRLNSILLLGGDPEGQAVRVFAMPRFKLSVQPMERTGPLKYDDFKPLLQDGIAPDRIKSLHQYVLGAMESPFVSFPDSLDARRGAVVLLEMNRPGNPPRLSVYRDAPRGRVNTMQSLEWPPTADDIRALNRFAIVIGKQQFLKIQSVINSAFQDN